LNKRSDTAVPTNIKKVSVEYIALVACLISIAAMGTDLMLPALDVIGADLQVENENDVHFIVTSFFLGMAIGQMIVGPLSDHYGRKPIVQIGYLVFIAGCFVSMFATNWNLMVLGRIMQGIGAAAPRIVSVAMVRDEFEGRQMAQILSLVMAMFILVPIFAPAIGQILIYIGGWHATFAGLIMLSVFVSTWFHIRQRETLNPEHRRPVRVSLLYSGLREVLSSRVVMGYTIASGLIFGAFIGYLGSSQQIFQITFAVGDWFVVYFALASAAIGVASLVNAKLVMQLGMRKLTSFSLACIAVVSLVFTVVFLIYDEVPLVIVFVIWQMVVFFFVGIVFGNLSALSLEPLGHVAGLGAAFVGSLSLFISLPLAWAIGALFDGTVIPLVAGFSILGFSAWAVVFWTEFRPHELSSLSND